MVLAVFSCLFCLLAAPPLLPMVLATGSKPGVHPLSNVLYHSQPARLSDLAAANVPGLSSRYVTHLFIDSVTQTCVDLTAEISMSLKWFSIRFIHRSCLCCWPCWFSVSGRWSSQAGNHYLQFSPRKKKSLSHDLFIPHWRTKNTRVFYSDVKVCIFLATYPFINIV